MKPYFLLLLLSVITLSVSAQYRIKSKVVDTNNARVVEMATVRLLSEKDSALVQGAQSDLNGNFTLSNVKSGKYILLISSVGYHDNSQNILVEKQDLMLKNIDLKENAQLLSEIEVKGTAAQMIVKGDTIEFNASAFKTSENAVVEELLKRLPGVEISSEGKITVNGEEITKIRVDGEKFFDDDIEMATKNIPADLVEKVQVLEKKSDMAQLTGFEDDDTERIINLTIKPNRKKGTFGNINGGVGMDIDNTFRYDANMFLNLMRGESQTAITGGANNVNTARSSRGRGNFSSGSGITDSQNIGINNNKILNKNLKFGGDVSFNHSSNYAETSTDKESYLKASVYNDYSNSESRNENYSLNGRVEIEWVIDSLNTLIVQPNINYNRSFTDTYREYTNMADKDTISDGYSKNRGDGHTVGGGLRAIYNRKFHKKGRSLTFNLNTTFNNSINESFNDSRKESIDTTQIVDQRTNNQSNRFNTSLRISFVEPLWNNKNQIEIAANLQTTRNVSNKKQYDKDALSNYNILDTIYSNDFENLFIQETIELNYRFTEKNYNIMLGVKADPSQTFSSTIYGNGDERNFRNSVLNFSPTARFQYNFGPKKFARIDYRGYSRQPSVNQMQPVKNNSNLMNETVGNQELNPAFDHRLRMLYTSFNDQNFSSLSISLNGGLTKDALVSNSIYDTTGKQYNQTVNSQKTPYNISGGLMYNRPLFERKFHVNTNTSLNYQTRYGYSNKGNNLEEIDIENLPLGDLSKTSNFNINEQLSFTFTHDLIEIGTKGSVRYSNTYNTLSDRSNVTWDWTVSENVVLHLPKSFTISTDLNYRTRTGYSNFDQNELLWNASIEKTLFKNKGTLSLKAFDILRRQLNIRQSIGDNYVQFTESNTLRSYFLLSFTYKISKFLGGASESDMRIPGRGHGNRPPMM